MVTAAFALLAKNPFCGIMLTLAFTADQAVQSVTATIDENAAVVNSAGGNAYTATRTMQSGDTAGTVAFTINFENTSGTDGVEVTSTTDNSSVTFTLTDTTNLNWAAGIIHDTTINVGDTIIWTWTGGSHNIAYG